MDISPRRDIYPSFYMNCCPKRKACELEQERQIRIHQPRNIDRRSLEVHHSIQNGMASTLHDNIATRCQQSIRKLSDKVRASAEDLFWEQLAHYIPLIYRDQLKPSHEIYSPVLHIAVLAYASRLIKDQHQPAEPGQINYRWKSLHHVLRVSIDRLEPLAMDLPTCQALVILSEIEYGDGQYNAASMHLDQAYKTARRCLKGIVHETSFSMGNEGTEPCVAILKMCTYLDLQRKLLPILGSSDRMSILGDDVDSMPLPKDQVDWRMSTIGKSEDLIFHTLQKLLEMQVRIANVAQDLLDYLDCRVSTRHSVTLNDLEAELEEVQNNLPESIILEHSTAPPGSILVIRMQLHATYMVLYAQLAMPMGTGQRPTGGKAQDTRNIVERFMESIEMFETSLSRFINDCGYRLVPSLVAHQIGVVLELAFTTTKFEYRETINTSILHYARKLVATLDSISMIHRRAKDIRDQSTVRLSIMETHISELHHLLDENQSDAYYPSFAWSIPQPSRSRSRSERLSPSTPRQENEANRDHTTRSAFCLQLQPLPRPQSRPKVHEDTTFLEDPVFPAYAKELSEWSGLETGQPRNALRLRTTERTSPGQLGSVGNNGFQTQRETAPDTNASSTYALALSPEQILATESRHETSPDGNIPGCINECSVPFSSTQEDLNLMSNMEGLLSRPIGETNHDLQALLDPGPGYNLLDRPWSPNHDSELWFQSSDLRDEITISLS